MGHKDWKSKSESEKRLTAPGLGLMGQIQGDAREPMVKAELRAEIGEKTEVREV